MTSNVTSGSLPPQLQYIVDHHTQTIGMWFIGGIGDILLQGAILIMGADYWAKYQKDPLYLRILVAVLSVANVLKTTQTAAILWHKLVVGFGDYIAAGGSTWYSSSLVITSQLISTGVQLFFAHRLYRLLRWNGFWLFLVPLIPTLLMGVGGAIAMTVAVYHTPTVDALATFHKIIIVQLTGNLTSDVLITILTSIHLYRSKTGIQRTDNMITRLTRITWLTALPPTICAILHLATYMQLAPSGDSTFIIFSFWAPKFYSISMLYTLNARGTLFSEDSYVMSSRLVSVPLSDDLRFAPARSHTVGMPSSARGTNAPDSSLCEDASTPHTSQSKGQLGSGGSTNEMSSDRHSLKDDGLHSADSDNHRTDSLAVPPTRTRSPIAETVSPVRSLIDTARNLSFGGGTGTRTSRVSFAKGA